MKSFTTLLLIFLPLASVESDGNSNSTFNNITNSNRFTKSTLSRNNTHNLNTSVVGDYLSSSSAAFRDKRGTHFALDQSEIARQNQITQQILSNYLERRLFPHRSANQKIPTIAEILPKPKTSTARPRPRGFASSSATYKRGAAKQQQRKTYGNGHKNRNSLLQRHKQQPTTTPRYEDDYEEEETEKKVNYNNSRKRPNNSSNENINDDFADDAVVEDVEEEPVEEEHEQQQERQQQQRHRQHQMHRHHYRYLEDIDDNEPDGQESLQSVESEQHDHYYSSNGSSGDIFSRDPSENEIDSGIRAYMSDSTIYKLKFYRLEH